MITNYFTFGKGQVHSVNGRTFDGQTIIKITAENPRQVMFDHFGKDWAFQYDNYEQLNPKKWWSNYKIIDIQKNEVIEEFNKFSEANNYE